MPYTEDGGWVMWRPGHREHDEQVTELSKIQDTLKSSLQNIAAKSISLSGELLQLGIGRQDKQDEASDSDSPPDLMHSEDSDDHTRTTTKGLINGQPT